MRASFLLVVVAMLMAEAAARTRLKRRDLDPQTCVDNFDIHRDKIIRTEDSRDMGAKYINEIDLGSRDECLRLCCETETCDVFVFEEKSPGSCYLFHCGPPEDFKCKFTRHTNFSSAILAVNRHLAELEDQIKLTKHEQDLASLRKQFQETVTTTKPTTPHSVVQVHETIPPAPGKLSRRCSRFQFECHSSEECIAIYNACDGIPQCADGSDEAPELGCPATTTLPPSNLPPREIMPRLPSIQQASQYNVPENMPLTKDIPIQHHPAFMSPISSQDSPPWPHHLDQLPQSIQHAKQYNDNMGGSHIFNHKGGLQVTETDGLAAVPLDYKPMPYDSVPENSWQHRNWPQMQQEQINMNEGPPMYHLEMEPKTSWKQQAMQQNMQVQNSKFRMENNQNRLSQEMPPEKLNIPTISNIFQDREKMWAVPQQQQNLQENLETYPQRKMIALPEEIYIKNKLTDNSDKNYSPPSNDKHNNGFKSKDEYSQVENNNHSNEDHSESNNNESKLKEEKSHINKTKKKHLKSEHISDNDKSVSEKNKQTKETPVSNSIIMGRQFDDDVHDGAAERPPGAILLLTLGVCMTSIMVVLIGCRLKMARRRMRRLGKSPFAHDADYLVNGMYL
ncbi:uncharacterized protein LOC143911699 [Arctopsyche grandis]|uniref:uncharacterized protein LOC143911699 n=1 Tax=Arctopsyche grandis TaxID=121162 RepID=UPI00406D9F0B